MVTILASTSSFGESAPYLAERLEEKRLRLIKNPFERKLTEAELVSLLVEYKPTGLLAGTETITRGVLEQAKKHLRVISRVGVGWDNVDRQAADELGIQVFRTAGVLNQAVAELTIGLMLSALRSITWNDRLMRAGQWQKQMGGLLQDKTVGIIGFGNIGKRVGELVTAFGARVIFYDPEPMNVPWAEAVSLKELLDQADIITIHASGKETILGAQELRSVCKRGIILINTARGELIDEAALHECLVNGQVGFACLDVFADEPYCGPFCSLDNVILTPHIGSYAKEARIRMEEIAVENLLQGLGELKI
jgi:D-3-phosphoglycerate dehydrogenase